MPVSSLLASAPLLTPAAFEFRRVVPHLYSAALTQPVRLGLHPLPLGQAYSVVSFWEERLTGQVKRTTLTKTIELAAAEQAGALRVGYEASTPEFQKPDLSSFERVLLLLATL